MLQSHIYSSASHGSHLVMVCAFQSSYYIIAPVNWIMGSVVCWLPLYSVGYATVDWCEEEGNIELLLS